MNIVLLAYHWHWHQHVGTKLCLTNTSQVSIRHAMPSARRVICVCMFIVWYPNAFSRLHNLHQWYWNSLLYGQISSGENSKHFLQLMPFTIIHFSFHQVPITGGWTEAVWEACQTPLHMASIMLCSVTVIPLLATFSLNVLFTLRLRCPCDYHFNKILRQRKVTLRQSCDF